MKGGAIFLSSLLLIGFFVRTVTSNSIQGKKFTCPPENSTCYFKMVISEHMSMTFDSKQLFGSKGKLYYIDYNDNDKHVFLTEEQEKQVMSVDGTFRLLQVINEQIPGPAIIVYENQRLVITVVNNMITAATSIHWHGIDQVGTPWMDGVGYVTQCPIGPGQGFVYDFTVTHAGTFWYHSHVGGQISEGIFGALIIKERTPIYKVEKDFIMTVADFHHESMNEVYTKIKEANYYYGKPVVGQDGPDMATLGITAFTCYLIEGKSRFYYPNNATYNTETPLTKYSVKPSKSYRFRVIHSGADIPMRVSVDDHSLTMIATDGYNFNKEDNVESVILYPGERYDFILKTKSTSTKNYWIRAASLSVNPYNPDSLAILAYSNQKDEPTTKRKTCTEENPCRVMNCAYGFFPKNFFNGKYIHCISVASLRRIENDVPIFTPGESVEAFFNFQLGSDAHINGKSFALPGVSSLTQSNQIDKSYNCSRKECLDKDCYCTYEYDLTGSKTYQFIFTNNGNGGFTAHPVHMHGHSFWVLKLAFGEQDKNGTLKGKDGRASSMYNPDLACIGKGNTCNNVKWKNPTWGGDNIDGINLKKAQRKDVITVAPGGYAVVRIKADNPGKWIVHCHMEHHLMEGMAFVMKEDFENVPKTPENFPVCQSFGYTGNPFQSKDMLETYATYNDPKYVDDEDEHFN